MNPPPPPVPPPQPQQEKKGLSGLAIAGIGCGALLLIGMVVAVIVGLYFAKKVKEVAPDFQKNPAKAAAVLAVKMNPALELVGTDDAKNEITVREKKTGEVFTMSFEDAKNGKVTVKNSKGEVISVDGKAGPGGAKVVVKGPDGQTMVGGDAAASAPPAWVPVYPGIKPQAGGVKQETKEKASGTFMAQTNDAPAKVSEFYDSKLKAAGYETQTTTIGGEMSVVTGTRDGGKRTVNVMINTEKGVTNVVITYDGPNP